MAYYTPLRYPGGKGKLSSFIKDIFTTNNLLGGVYIEPYSGGAGVALYLLLEGYAENIIINDIDYTIYSFWKTLIDDTEWLCQKIYDTDVSIKNWYIQREINLHPKQFSLNEVGFSTFFMNRTNRSGIIKGGVIGGKDQTGKYKIDARYNKNDLINRILRISKYKSKIEVYNKDAIELSKSILQNLGSKCLFYFDPPYFNKSKTLYTNSYTKNDHINVSTFIKQLKCPWIVTYDDVPSIRRLYEPCPYSELLINYSAYKNAVKGKEILFYGNLVIA